jgi:hypothetical protein
MGLLAAAPSIALPGFTHPPQSIKLTVDGPYSQVSEKAPR